MEKATFGGGCFWGIEATFSRIPGVQSAVSGYMGGNLDNPTYEQVCSGTTGHAEVVQVEFDPDVVSYQQLLEAFFQMHDPTQVNRQGPDVGTQYRSVVFYHSPEQERIANETFARLQAEKRFSRPIATELVPAPTFWPAEEYHQKYLARRGLSNCHI
jgi:peptide-methionine (S)-S-oxide reductase